MEPQVLSPAGPGPNFPNTRWSLVRRAGAGTDDEARVALEHLCREYWYPLYAYVHLFQRPPREES